VMKHKRRTKTVLRPMALNERQRARLAIQWTIDAVEKRKGPLPVLFARECLQILKGGESSVLKRKEEMHQQAMISRGNVKA